MTGKPLAVTWAESQQAPLWVGVALYAVAHADARGHAHLQPGQLRSALAPDSRPEVLSRAIGSAVRKGWLHRDSRSWHLILAGGGR